MRRTATRPPRAQIARPARHALYPLALVLCVGLCACSSPPPSASSQPSAPARPPAPPDPCTVLTDGQVSAAYTGTNASTTLALNLLTHKGNYNPARDETGVTLLCLWSAPSKTGLAGGTVSLPLLQLVLAPASQYANESCATPVDGIGQAACTTNLGGLAVKDGSFDLDITDEASATPDSKVERQLAGEALAALPGNAPGP